MTLGRKAMHEMLHGIHVGLQMIDISLLSGTFLLGGKAMHEMMHGMQLGDWKLLCGIGLPFSMVRFLDTNVN